MKRALMALAAAEALAIYALWQGREHYRREYLRWRLR